ncbi:MAG: hypothetical protein WBF16_01300, partial [Candidatus Deferrimicrobiaceae bacterium]
MVDGILNYLWLVPALPLLGVIVNSVIALFVERPLLLAESAHGEHTSPAYRKLVAFVGPAVVGASFVVSLLAVLALAARPAHDRLFVQVLFPWIQAGTFFAPAAFQLDPLSSVM